VTTNPALLSSKSDNWPTDPKVFQYFNDEFQFTTDVCADDDNAKCSTYFTKYINGLIQPWTGVCWMNPPYGRTIGLWMQKAYEESRQGCTVVCLVPARTDTRWWQDYVPFASEVRFFKGRLRFGNGQYPAPFPSALVVFKPSTTSTQYSYLPKI
jgi:phage N-6-adenine-methyltransferase